MRFDSSEIVLPTSPVNLTLRNADQMPHDITIPALNIHIEAATGRSATVGLRGLQPGSYEAFCAVPGHMNPGMRLMVSVR